MKPVDFRNETFAQLQSYVNPARRAVLDAWRQHGPGTTREIAERSGIDLLTFRPRTTELFQIGLVCLVDGEHGNEGSYRARTVTEWQIWFGEQQRAATECQMKLI